MLDGTVEETVENFRLCRKVNRKWKDYANKIIPKEILHKCFVFKCITSKEEESHRFERLRFFIGLGCDPSFNENEALSLINDIHRDGMIYGALMKDERVFNKSKIDLRRVKIPNCLIHEDKVIESASLLISGFHIKVSKNQINLEDKYVEFVKEGGLLDDLGKIHTGWDNPTGLLLTLTYKELMCHAALAVFCSNITRHANWEFTSWANPDFDNLFYVNQNRFISLF